MGTGVSVVIEEGAGTASSTAGTVAAGTLLANMVEPGTVIDGAVIAGAVVVTLLLSNSGSAN